MKLHIVVILLLTAEVAPEDSGGYNCRNLEPLVTFGNCRDNSRIQISKDMNNYRLRLCPSEQQCSTPDGTMSLNWIRCRDICNACQSLLGPNRKIIDVRGMQFSNIKYC